MVLVLAVIATGAAVLTPAYARAAQQSVLTDTLRSAPATGTSLTVAAEGTGDGPEGERAGDSQQVIDAAITGYPLLKGLIGKPTTAVETDAEVQKAGDRVITRYAYRDRLCAQVRVTGECPIDAEQVIVSDRAADARGWEVGQTITLLLAKTPVKREIVGTYTPIDPGADYWGVNGYFAEGGVPDPETGVSRTDAIFTGSEEDIRAVSELSGVTSGIQRTPPRITMTLRYPIAVDRLRLDDVEKLRHDVENVAITAAGADLRLTTAMPQLLDEVSADQASISKTVPLVAVPLVLLCFFVLMLLVSSLAEERGPEIALAKLRGYPSGRSARFGQGEVLALIALATPLGIAAGLGAAAAAAKSFLAEGTEIELRWEPFAAGVAALVVGSLAAWVASRRTVRSSVLSLLRRVPNRSGWKATAVEGVAVALAAAAIYTAWRDRGSALALLAAPLLAVVAGIVIGRVVRVLASARLVLARRRGNVAMMLANAQLARRPGRYRVITVMTVAVALLGFAATAWDVAAQARAATAQNAVGAARVYSVAATNPQAVIDAVRAVAPDGTAMPVVRRVEQYGSGHVEVIGLPAEQLARIAQWRGHTSAELATLAAKLHPAAPDPVTVGGLISARVNVASLGDVPLRLGVLVAGAGHDPHTYSMGELRKGTRTYSVNVPSGRFAGLIIQRPAGNSDLASLTMTLEGITVGGSSAIELGNVAAWRFAKERALEATVQITTGTALKVEMQSQGYADVYVSYLDAPGKLPVVLAGAAPADRGDAKDFTFPGFAEQPQPFEVIATESTLPRAGDHAIMTDLDYALRQADNSSGLADGSSLFYEVWTTGSAPDLRAKLAAAGVRVTRTETVAGFSDQLGRRAPALSLRLYLMAGAVAVALALGVVLLVTRIGADARRMELAALRVAGVRPRVLRRGLRREYLLLLGAPIVTGFLVGVGSAWLMIPDIPLVSVGEFAAAQWHPELGALPIAAASCLAALVLAVVVATRLLRKSTPDLLRGESR